MLTISDLPRLLPFTITVWFLSPLAQVQVPGPYTVWTETSAAPAITEAFALYRRLDRFGYRDMVALHARHQVPIVYPDKESTWYQGLPVIFKGSGMFVHQDYPAIMVNHVNAEGMVTDEQRIRFLSIIVHESTHVFANRYPDVLETLEGVRAPTITSPTDPAAWLEQELFAANRQYRLAHHLETLAGIEKGAGSEFALSLAQSYARSLEVRGRLVPFMETYGTWLEPEVRDLIVAR